MRLCTECTQKSEPWSETAPPGRCGECGRAFDVQGLPILDESVTCPIHEPILASCPHSSADTEAPAPAASWLVDETETAGARRDL
jgi:hypothetical protein